VSRTVVLSATVILASVAACMAAVVVASVSQKAEAAFPGRNGDIAFVGHNGIGQEGIYRMNSDGTGARRLAEGFAPAFSPNGKLTAFSSDRNGSRGIYLMRADGSNQTRLTNDGGEDPAWVPRARTLVYSAGGTDGNRDLYAVSFDAAWKPTGPPTRLTTDPKSDVSPAVSPDGKKVVFSSDRYRSASGGGWGLYVMDVGRPEGESNKPVLLSDSSERYFFDRFPDWSPNGKKIVYRRQPDPHSEDLPPVIGVMNSDGTGHKSLTPTSFSYSDSPGAFSPDGKKIVFSRTYYEEDITRIWRMNADGSNLTQLTRTHTNSRYNPDWQPLP
jgi:Tol biopolymer transport system component